MRPYRALAALLLLLPSPPPTPSTPSPASPTTTPAPTPPPSSPPSPASSPARCSPGLPRQRRPAPPQHRPLRRRTINYTGTGNARGIVVDLKPIPLDETPPRQLRKLRLVHPRRTRRRHPRPRPPLPRRSLRRRHPPRRHPGRPPANARRQRHHRHHLPHHRRAHQPHPRRAVNFSIDQPSRPSRQTFTSPWQPPPAPLQPSPLSLQQAVKAATRHPYNEGLTGITLPDILLDPFRRAGYIQAALDNIQRTVAPRQRQRSRRCQRLPRHLHRRASSPATPTKSPPSPGPHAPLLRRRLRPRQQAPPRRSRQ